ncbi:hypothetical protein DCAR_0205688 [Daucus carota subsp. sativus]|uniref:Mannosyltransferase n=1 Tax=Daucus carota subsp. sativus TaxID=79200 RepID=A0AAF0WAR1_DAUCS|nr:hypothetical protein DCAR_0205688 [Daucus carota subsp. sativus]
MVVAVPEFSLDDPGRVYDGEEDKGLGFLLPVLALGMLRYMSATTNIIHDSDEVFNCWEPLHFLIYKSGFQTWEYRSSLSLPPSPSLSHSLFLFTCIYVCELLITFYVNIYVSPVDFQRV